LVLLLIAPRILVEAVNTDMGFLFVEDQIVFD
jgi:hypothetical protein